MSKDLFKYGRILLAFLLGAGAVLAFNRFYPSPSAKKELSQPKDLNSQEPDQVLPKGWQRYISPYQTFSIGYPAEQKKVLIEENRPPMEVCNLKAGDVFFRIYPKDYDYIMEPEFGGDLMLTIVGLNNEDNISLKNWLEAYCPEAWIRETQEPIKTELGQAVRAYSRESGKKVLIGQSYAGSLYFLYGYSNKQTNEPEELLAKMLNTFQMAD